MDSFPANKTNATPAFLPFASSTFSSPCDSSPENPVHSAHTSLNSSVVTPEDQSPNAFPLHPHSLHPCPPELRRLEALHQPTLPPPCLSSTTILQNSASSPLVQPTLFDFVIAHPKISQTKLPLKNQLPPSSFTGSQSLPPVSSPSTYATNFPLALISPKTQENNAPKLPASTLSKPLKFTHSLNFRSCFVSQPKPSPLPIFLTPSKAPTIQFPPSSPQLFPTVAKLFATTKPSAPLLSYEPSSPGEFHLPRAKASSFSFRRSLAFSPTPKPKRTTTSHLDQVNQTSSSPVCPLQDQSTQPSLPKHPQPLCKFLNLISIPYLSLLCCCPVLLINISISFFSLFLLLPFLLLFALFISLCELVPPFSLFDMLRRLLLITPLRFFFTLKALPLNFLFPFPPPRFATSPTCSALLCLSLLPLHYTPLFLPVLVLLLTATARRNSYLNNLLFLLSTQPLPSTTLSATAFTLLHIAGPPGPALLAAILPVLLLLTAALPHWLLVLHTTLSSLPTAFSTFLHTAATHTTSPPPSAARDATG